MNTFPDSSQQPLTTTPIPTPTPWETWTLDQQFLSDVYNWNIAHPETTFHRMVKRISASIEEHDVLFELVPDGPIPIRGFVKAVAHVVKLGAVSTSDFLVMKANKFHRLSLRRRAKRSSLHRMCSSGSRNWLLPYETMKKGM
jgi:hypothetical protein